MTGLQTCFLTILVPLRKFYCDLVCVKTEEVIVRNRGRWGRK